MTKLNIILEIRTFTYETDYFPYFIDEEINIKTGHINYYITNNDYGIKMLMFETHLKDIHMIDFSNDTIKHYIKQYKDMFED